MAAVKNTPAADGISGKPGADGCCLQKFRLYETQSTFYMVGRDKGRTLWRVLKIDRLEPFDLNILEDSAMYSENECNDLLKRIHEGNMSTGGLKFVTSCYGIVGFVKFLGPYYMMLITKRRLIGSMCGYNVYAITKSAMIAVPNSTVRSNMTISKNENRYKRLLCTVDLTKDFFFSYSYPVMRTLQKNLCDSQTGHVLYETMFVWNEFLTRGIRNRLKNNVWTVALVYGFFKQAKISVTDKDFWLTLIARRSRHYAGTRYLKRGVNDNGCVANDVETEQIVFEDVPTGTPTQISSIVQNRGSIPLLWSQETSKLNMKPDIILRKKDENFEATRLHFMNLVKRYGNPIVILNLIKMREKKPRESILRAEFANAIDFLNKDLAEEHCLRFLHWDLHKHMRSKATNVLLLLGKIATYALHQTGFFYCQLTPVLGLNGVPKWPDATKGSALSLSCNKESDHIDSSYSHNDTSRTGLQEYNAESSDTAKLGYSEYKTECNGNCLVKPTRFQTGVLRTNCIDCLDRTNVAQYAYGLAALGHQLHALGLVDVPKLDLDAPLADELMDFYEGMGDTLALQYGGSTAHNKVFSERRGQWKATTQTQEFFRTLQRYYSNAYMDAERQEAIDLFLGYFQALQEKSTIWDLNSDRNCNPSWCDNSLLTATPSSSMKRSQSDGNILHQNNISLPDCFVGIKDVHNSLISSEKAPDVPCARRLSSSNTGTSTRQKDESYSRYTPSMSCRKLFAENEHGCSSEAEVDASTSSNFLDLDWLSSSGNSFDDDIYERSTVANLSAENVISGLASDSSLPLSENDYGIKRTDDHATNNVLQNSDTLEEFSDSFVRWVNLGETLSLT
ncbi:hypothetical protein M5K25_022920 [Dendrobium thyrsiflorum]|uniref:SAC domain-containing protein n=1 Tax=Dendrobium thyrsiflorum TaxID=117978 RepID=A0ABD0UDI9_DENTH